MDHRVVEFAWRLPRSLKIQNGVTKRLLRDVLYRRVPKALVDRPETGFTVPVDDWLRGPLRSWAQEVLFSGGLESLGILRTTPVREAWTSFQRGRSGGLTVWAVLILQLWMDRWARPIPEATS